MAIKDDDRDVDQKYTDDMLAELERVGITVVKRGPVAGKYHFDALIQCEHEGTRFLAYLEISFSNRSSPWSKFDSPLPLFELEIVQGDTPHETGQDGGVDLFLSFDVTTRFHHLTDLTHVPSVKSIPSFMLFILKKWNVLDEVVQNSESYLFKRDINPNNMPPDPFNPDDATVSTPPAAAAKFDHGTKACVDAPPEQPGLDFDHIAASIAGLVDEIASESTHNKPTSSAPLMTIGLYGPWGAGKSTLIRALQNIFCAKNYTTITINPWKWDGKGDIHAYVFKHFRATLKKKFPFPMFMVSVRRVLKALGRLMWYGVALALLVFATTALENAGLFGKDGIGDLSKALKWADTTWGVWVGSGGALASAVVLYFWKQIRTKADDLIDKQLFGHRPDALGAEGLSTAYQDIAAGWKAVGENIPPFVFFFDDLDRCSPERVALFAETVHSLTAAGCITFISCDEAYITAALNAKYEDVWRYHPDGDKFGKRFLEKIVQIPYRVPSVQEKHLKELGIATTRQNLVVNAGGASAQAPAQASTAPADASTREAPKQIEPSPMAFVGIAALVEESIAPLDISENEAELLGALIVKAVEQANPKDNDQALRVAAFVLADRYMPGWLDDFTGHAPGERELPPKSEKIEAMIRKCLGEDKAQLLPLYDLVSMRLPSVLSWLLSGAVEPMRLNIRQVKALSNTINLHLRIGNTLSEPEARRVAAFVFADMHDPDWLDRLYHGQDGHGTEIGLYDELDSRLREVLGTEQTDLLPLYGQIGRHPALRPPGEVAGEAPGEAPDEAPPPS